MQYTAGCDVPVMMFSVLDWTGAVAELLRNVSTLSVYSIPAVRPLHMNFETFPAHVSRDTETDVFQPRQHRQWPTSTTASHYKYKVEGKENLFV